ncbi:MAG: phosphotransferase [Acidobacteria bacterium]|nr:phosphotransferase [Acidobacteriota bacterium]
MSDSVDGLESTLADALAPHLCGASLSVLGREPIGTGQMSTSLRVTVSTEPPGRLPASLVVKQPSPDPTSRAASRATRTYEIETSFYREVLPRVAVCAPRCWAVRFLPASDDFLLVLDDLAPRMQGDQIAGASVAQVASAVDELAMLHGPVWGDESLARLDWLNRADAEQRAGTRALLASCWPRFVDRYGDRLDAVVRRVGHSFVDDPGTYFDPPRGELTVVHGDFRLDNLLFDPAGGRTAVVDFQTAVLGWGATDLAYLVGGSLPTDVRRLHDRELVDRWVTGLEAFGARPSDPWGQYRRQSWAGLIMAVVASVLVQRSERGDEMFVAMANRHAAHADDMDALSAVRG